MPVTTAAITSRRARRARRNETTRYYFPSSQPTRPRSHSELVNPAALQCAKESSSCCTKAQGRPPLVDCGNIRTKKLCGLVTFGGDVSMEDGEAHTLAMTRSNPESGSRTMSASSSNESSPTTTRAPVNSDETPQGIERSFKRRRSFNSRKRDVDEIIKKHPHKVPIIIERAKNEKSLGLLDKSKFLVPEELTMSQLTTIIRRRLRLTDTQSFYLIVNRRTMVSASMTLAEVYRSDKDTDGFLYITYASQEMFG